MTSKARVKTCLTCKSNFTEKYGDSNKQWEKRLYCSIECNNRSAKRKPKIFEGLLKKQVKRKGCWSWSGSKDSHGYGILSSRKGRGGSPEKAHRVSYEYYIGSIPDGIVVRHKCDNPECTNPNHLELGTQKDNVADMMKRGRFNPVVIGNLKRYTSLSAEQVKEIELIKFVGVNGRGEGETMKDVAKKYKVSVCTIKKVKDGIYPLSTKRNKDV